MLLKWNTKSFNLDMLLRSNRRSMNLDVHCTTEVKHKVNNSDETIMSNTLKLCKKLYLMSVNWTENDKPRSTRDGACHSVDFIQLHV